MYASLRSHQFVKEGAEEALESLPLHQCVSRLLIYHAKSRRDLLLFVLIWKKNRPRF